MAVTKGTAIASPQIFTSDPIEQIFAKGTMDQDMGGIAYAYLNAARGQRQDDQNVYMNSLAASNRMASELMQREEANKMLLETLKLGPEYAKAGLPIANVPGIAQHFTGAGTDPQTADASLLVNLLKRADIAEKYAKAAASGKEYADETTVETDMTPTGAANSTIKTKSKGGLDRMIQRQNQAVAADNQSRQTGVLRNPTQMDQKGANELRAQMKRRVLQNGQ